MTSNRAFNRTMFADSNLEVGIFIYMDIFKEINSKSFDNLRALESQMQRGLSNASNLEKDEPAGFGAQGIIMGEIPSKYNTQEYLKAAVGWVYAAVSAICDGVAKTSFELYRAKQDGEIEEVDSHPVLDFLEKVNGYTTSYDHKWLSQEYLELTGEAPWFLDRGESGEGEPQSMILIRPDRLTIEANKDPRAESPIAGYKYQTDFGHKIDIKQSELVFLKYPDPINPWRGRGTLAAAAKTFDIDSYSEDYNLRLFYNSARPDSILSTEQKLSSKQKGELIAQVKNLYQGVNKSHKTAVMDMGLKWDPMQMTQRDMEFLEQQRFSRDKILSIFRVHKSIVAITEDVNLANAKTGEYAFAKWTIVPKLTRIMAQLNEFLLPMFKGTEGLFLSFESPVPADVDTELRILDSGLGKGWMTINEARESRGLDPVGEEGDVIYIPFSMTPLDMVSDLKQPIETPPAEEKPKEEDKPAKMFKGIKVKNINKKNVNKAKRKSIISNSGGGYQRAIKNMHVSARAKQVKDEAVKKLEVFNKKINEISLDIVKRSVKTKEVEDDKIKDERQKMISEFESLYLKSVSYFERKFILGTRLLFSNQKDRLLKRIPKKAVDVNEWLLDEGSETDIMVRVYSPLQKDIITDQGKRAARLVGGGATFDNATRRVRDFIAKRTFKFSFEVNEETNALLKSSLNEGIAAGEGIPQLRNRVGQVFDDMERYRSERIARSEVIRASNFGANEAYAQSGVVNQVEWLATGDENTCEFCNAMDGKIQDLGDNFVDKGDTFTGANGGKLNNTYDKVQYPPLHVSCRCTIIPVIK